MKTVILPVIPEQSFLNESHQKNEIKFCVTDEQGNGLHEWIKCRDYLGDVVWSETFNKSISQYGFTWHPRQLDRSKTRLLLRISKNNPNFIMQLQANKDRLIKDLNTTLDITFINPSSQNAQEDYQYLYVESEGFWMQTIPAISFFSFILKCACIFKNLDDMFNKDFLKQEADNYPSYEVSYLRQFIPEAFKVLYYNVKESLVNIQKPNRDSSSFSGEIHNNSGFMSRRSDFYQFFEQKHWFSYKQYQEEQEKENLKKQQETALRLDLMPVLIN